MTFCAFQPQLNSLRFSTWAAMANWTRTSKSWFSQWLKKRCLFLQRSYAMSKSTNFTRIWCERWDCLKSTSTSSKMSLELTFSRTNLENTSKLETRNYKSSTAIGRRSSLSLRTKAWSGSRSSSTSTRSKWTSSTWNLIEPLRLPRSSHPPSSRKCRIMRNSWQSTRGLKRPWTTGKSSRFWRSKRLRGLKTLDKRMLIIKGKLF